MYKLHFFPLHDVVNLKGHEGFDNAKLQLGALECKVYHNVLMKSKSQIDFDRLRQIHYLDKAEEDRENSWECSKVLKHYEDRREDGNIQHNLLVEWNDINKTRSWVNFFALSLSNPIPIKSFARNNNLLHKLPFCHLTQYCKTKTSIEMAKVNKTLANSTCIRYKFGIQVPRDIKNAIELDRGKNGNALWEDAIKTKLEQLSGYQTFLVLDSGALCHR